jgi:hypothetical protein
MKPCCACDGPVHTCIPDITAGLSALPRQQNGFPEYRLAMLREIPLHLPLGAWRAREGDDPGIMLLEMWAYVLDIVGFYDERIANESYLRTAVLPPSLRRLVELISYQPRPALASSAILGIIADGHRSVTIPPRTGFRSDAFDNEPPQVFETETEFIVHPLKNEWTIAPVRSDEGSTDLLLELKTAALSQDQLVVLRSGTMLRAGRVLRVEPIQARDGATYKKLSIDPPPNLPASIPVESIEVLTPVHSAAVQGASAAFTSSSSLFSSRISRVSNISALTLDALYPELSESDTIVIKRGDTLHAAKVNQVQTVDVTVSPGTDTIPPVTQPATRISFDPPLSPTFSSDLRRLTVHFSMNHAGKLTRVAKTELNVSDFAPPGLTLEGVVEPLPVGVPKPGELLLLDAQDVGALANGTVDIDTNGAGKVLFATGNESFDPLLRTPVTVFGNLVEVTRGESVLNEVLGSGDPSLAFQSFKLGKHPLTYINDSAATNGRRTTLEVRVNGILWSEVVSFFGATPDSEVYTVRQNDDGESIVRFGDGVTGARLPSGVNNVTANYRFGAGAAKPPAGAIGQFAKPVEGLRRVVNPVAAGGGADGDQPDDIRKDAPGSALILGRAVSIPDFEALAREFGGVINVHVEWAWDERTQSAVVKVSFISDGGDIARKLRAFLIGFADPNTPLVAIEAKAQASKLVIDLEIDDRFERKTIVSRVNQKLIDKDTGLLSLQNIPIGQPLFRSKVFDAVLSVEGTRSVRSMTVDGLPAPFAMTVAGDRYLDFLEGLVVG